MKSDVQAKTPKEAWGLFPGSAVSLQSDCESPPGT